MMNYEGTILFYLLPKNCSVDDISEEDRAALQTIINDVHVFTDADECIDELSFIVDETIFLFLAPDRSNLISLILEFSYLHYIYASEPHSNSCTWKVRGVFPTRNMFLDQLRKDVNIAINTHSHLCLTKVGDSCRNQSSWEMIEHDRINCNRLHRLHQILLSVHRPTENIYEDLLHECRLIYAHNAAQNRLIDEFQKEYKADKAVWWYTRESFMFKIVNMSLRTTDILPMWTFRHYIQDLYQQLKNLNDQQQLKMQGRRHYTVYRGQCLSLNELKQLKDSVGSLIMIHSFISATKDRACATIFAGDDQSSPYRSVLFKVSVDESELEQNHEPFADISQWSAFESEMEIMFAMGTMLRIVDIDDDGCICLHVCSSNYNAKQDSLLSAMEKFGTYSLGTKHSKILLLFILGAMGEWNKIQQMRFDLQSLNDSSNFKFIHELILMMATYCAPQTMVADEYNCRPFSDFTELPLKFLQSLLPSQVANMFGSYIQKIIELNQKVYQDQNLTHWSFLLEPIRRTLNEIEAIKNDHDSKYHIIFDWILQHGKNTIDFYTDRITWNEFIGQSSEAPSITRNVTVDTLLIRANVLENRGDYNDAVSLLQESLSTIHDNTCKIILWQQLVVFHGRHQNWDSVIQTYEEIINCSDQSPNSLDVINACISCGQLYLNAGNSMNALARYQKALKLLQQHYPSSNPLLAEAYLGVGQSLERNQDYRGALTSYIEVIKCDHPETTITAHQQSGSIYTLMQDFDQARLHFVQCLSISECHKNIPHVGTLASVYINLIWMEHATENYEIRDHYIRQVLNATCHDSVWHFLVTNSINRLLKSGYGSLDPTQN